MRQYDYNALNYRLIIAPSIGDTYMGLDFMLAMSRFCETMCYI
jgi:hypothetical protein